MFFDYFSPCVFTAFFGPSVFTAFFMFFAASIALFFMSIFFGVTSS